MRRRIALGLALAAVLLLLSSRTFLYYRDNFSTHYPVKSVSAGLLRAGELPLWNFFAGGGQPLAGNPNTLTFYPDTLLYLVLPAHTAFNLHFWIHLVAGFFAMRALLVALQSTRDGSLLGASLYLASGIVVSSLAFYNLVTAIALVPLAFVAVEQLLAAPGLRRAIPLGAVFGLLALAGEPVIVLSVAASSMVLSYGRLTRRVVAFASIAIAIAAIVASPLFLAYSEIAGETERGMHAYSTETVLSASLSPSRFLEMVIGPFRGLTTDYGSGGYFASVPAGRWPPLFLTVFLGAILIPALFAAALRRYLVVFGLLAFFALGAENAVVVAMLERFESLRIVRYPEKLAIPMTVAAVVLIALWLDRAIGNRRARGASIAAIALLAIPLVAPKLIVAGAAGSLRVVAGCLLAIATRPPLAGLLAAIFGWGGFHSLFFNTSRTLFQVGAPPALRARVLSIHALAFMGMAPLSNLGAGLLAGAVGPLAGCAIAGAAMILATGWAWVATPVRRLE